MTPLLTLVGLTALAVLVYAMARGADFDLG